MWQHSIYYGIMQRLNKLWFKRQETELDKPVIKLSKAPRKGLAKPVKIALSSGHGGKDTGCKGPAGTTEAGMAMLISNAIQKYADPTIMDVSIYNHYKHKKNYKHRVRESNLWEAEYYIPIHLNWSPFPRTNGMFIMIYRDEKNRKSLAEYVAKTFVKEFPISFKDYDTIVDGVMVRDSGRGTYELRKPNAVTLYLELGFLSCAQWEDTLLERGNINAVAKLLVRSMQDWFIANPDKIPYRNVSTDKV